MTGTSATAALIDELAYELFDAERNGRPGPPLIARHPNLTPADAYAIQARYARLRVQNGAILIGRKIGATSRAIQDLFNVRTPDFGHLFEDMRIADGGTVAVSELIQPMIEPEIAFRLGRPLVGPGIDIDAVCASTAAIMPALEIIDSRIHQWQISFIDTVADNGSSARFVLGPECDASLAPGLDRESAQLVCDDQPLREATGAEVLGHPAAAVAWLANAISEFGEHLREGDIVLSGSFTKAEPVVAGRHYRADFGSMGSVSCTAQ